MMDVVRALGGAGRGRRGVGLGDRGLRAARGVFKLAFVLVGA